MVRLKLNAIIPDVGSMCTLFSFCFAHAYIREQEESLVDFRHDIWGSSSVFLLYEVPPHSLVTLFVLGSFHWFLWPKVVKLSIRCYLLHIAICLTVATLRAKLQRNGNPFPSSNLFPISAVSQIYIPLFSLKSHQAFCCCSEFIAIVCREICHILYKLFPTYDRRLLSMTNFMVW